MLLALSMCLAAILGFAAHRASVCTVRAVAEVLSTRRAKCLSSFAKTVLWVLALILPLLWLDSAGANRMSGYAMSSIALLGGLLFGMGAALNGGCAFSTLARLADGQLRMLSTLLGFVGGVWAAAATLHAIPVPRAAVSLSGIVSLAPIAGILTAAVWMWAIYEFRRLWSTRSRATSFVGLLLSHHYRLSSAAALIGIANGILYTLHGSWAYSGGLRQGVERLVAPHETTTVVWLVLLAGVAVGMVVSALQRRSFRLDARVSAIWAMNFVGGVLMGVGAEFIPGGNDVLILNSIPTFSPHAIPSYAAVLCGIAVVVVTMQRVTGREMRVDCSGDECAASSTLAKQP